MNRRKVKYVGSYPLVAGIDYASRKSLPRDRHGFEPLEGYFDRESDSDSSDASLLDDEVIQREVAKLLEKQKSRKRLNKSAKVDNGKNKEEVQENDTNQLPQPSSTRRSTRSTSHGYIESPQPTGLTPVRANSGLRTTDVRSRLTWSDSDEAGAPGSATPTRSSLRRSTHHSMITPNNTNVDDRREKRRKDTPHSSQLTSSRRVTRSSTHTSAVYTDTREPVPIATSSGLRTSDVESSRLVDEEAPGSPNRSTRSSRRKSAGRSLAGKTPTNDDKRDSMSASDGERRSRESLDDITDFYTRSVVSRVSGNFNPMKTSTANSKRSSQRKTRRSRKSVPGSTYVTTVTVASSDSDDDDDNENAEMIRGLLSNSPRALVSLSRIQHSDGDSDRTPTQRNMKEQSQIKETPVRRSPRHPANNLSVIVRSLVEPAINMATTNEDNDQLNLGGGVTALSREEDPQTPSDARGDEGDADMTPLQASVGNQLRVSFAPEMISHEETDAPATLKRSLRSATYHSRTTTSESVPVPSSTSTPSVEQDETASDNTVSELAVSTARVRKRSKPAMHTSAKRHRAADKTAVEKSNDSSVAMQHPNEVTLDKVMSDLSVSAKKVRRKKRTKVTMPKWYRSAKKTSLEGSDDSSVAVHLPKKRTGKRRVLESTAEVSQGEDQVLEENQSGDVENQSGDVEEKDYETSLKYDSGTNEDDGEEEEEENITFIGGKKLIRVPVMRKTDFTPGVRRSKRTRVAPLDFGEHLEYKIHTGCTPSKTCGGELLALLKPPDSGYHSSKKSKKVPRYTAPSAEDEDQFMTDPSDKETELLVATTTASSSPANISGDTPSPNDDIFIYKIFCEKDFSHGHIRMKRFSEKPKCKLGNNVLVGSVVKGKLILTINGREFPLKSQTYFKVPPGSVYGITNNQRSVAEFSYTIHKNISH